ncbi:hypothetical protein [Hymenobacter radiodurans]|uniref:hypothetical protein n=1 Tax=Hymenobacter radiodurans TaxID=2496028 RepID=UPI001058AB46|nr:hypothetical protein [Hymenobacter radiodurans]
MRHADLPERWKIKVREYLTATGETNYENLSCHHFPTDSLVRINFEDGSTAEFKYAFVIKAPEWQELAVFTEHCGYHLFRLYDELDLIVYRSGRDTSAS